MDESEILDFHLDCEEENYESIKVFYRDDFDMDCTNDDGETALYNAVLEKSLRLSDVLLSLGANPCIPNNTNDYPLHLAVEAEDMYLVKILLWNGARNMINELNSDGLTCLRMACSKENEEIVQLLLDFGARPNLSRSSLHELDLAFDQKNVNLIKAFLSVSDVESLNAKHKNGEDYIMLARKLKSPEIMEKLIVHGVDLNEETIQLLKVSGDQEFIDDLLKLEESGREKSYYDPVEKKTYISDFKNWVDFEAQWVEGVTTISEELIQIKGSRESFSEKINRIKGKVNINMEMMSHESRVEHIKDYMKVRTINQTVETTSPKLQDIEDPTPVKKVEKKENPEEAQKKKKLIADFQNALMEEDLEALSLLLSENHRRIYKVDDKIPALVFASGTDNLPLFHLLFKERVFKNQLNELKLCYKVSTSKKCQNIIGYLKILGLPNPPLSKMSSKIDPKSELYLACKLDDLDFFKEVRLSEHNLNAFYSKETLLTLSGKSGAAKCLEYILSEGAKVDLKNQNEETPLFGAVMKGSLDCVKLLIKYRSKIDTWNKGLTALMFAAAKGESEIAYTLLEAGADKSKKTTKGVDAIKMARAKGHEETALMIEKW